MKQKLFGLLLVIALSYWAIAPLTGSGFFPMHDDTQVARVVAMGKALRNGQFPVRWVADLGYGYGYPIFNFYGPLPYYVGGFLYTLGVSGIVATKIMLAVGVLGAGVAMYLAFAGPLGIAGAIVASLLYMYAPYHAVQVYVRGAVGELYTLIFLPLIVAGVMKVAGSEREKGVVLAGIGLAGVILSHTIMGYTTTLLFALLVAGTGLVSVIRRQVFPWGAFVRLLLLGLGLSAFFWLPALVEMGATRVAGQVGGGANLYDNFVCLPQLWSSQWGYGGSIPGCVDGFSFMIGKLHIVAAAVGFLALVFARKRDMLPLAILASSVVIISIFFMLPVSATFWRMIPKAEYVQYPWRFLVYVMLGTSLVTGAAVAAQKKMIGYAFAIGGIAALLLLYPKRFVPQSMYEQPAEAFELAEDIRFRVSKISDEYVTSAFVIPQNPGAMFPNAVLEVGDFELELEVDTEIYKKYFVDTEIEQPITMRLMHFPGWRYWVNSREVTPMIVGGSPSIMMPKGRSALEARFENTWPRSIGNLVSIAALLFILYFYGRTTQKNHA